MSVESDVQTAIDVAAPSGSAMALAYGKREPEGQGYSGGRLNLSEVNANPSREATPWIRRAVYLFGFLSFAIAAISIIDMFVPRPYDGVILRSDRPGQLVVLQVIGNSGAAMAGVVAGDQVVGIGRNAVRSAPHAAALLNEYAVGESVPYLVKTSAGRLKELYVELGTRRIGDTSYVYASVLGFTFFFIGLFVFANQRRSSIGQLFFTLCGLFLLFLVCRLRPASYSEFDKVVMNTGTAALLFLPPVFLNFFLLFPHPVWEGENRVVRLLDGPRVRRLALAAMYVLPPLFFVTAVLLARYSETSLLLISGAPAVNWWVLALFVVLGLVALAANARRLPRSRERSGAAIVFGGAVAGLVPFLIVTVAFSSALHTDEYFLYGVIPLALVPLTFAYAIARFQLLDVKVILRKSLMYTATTAVVTLLYAAGISWVNVIFQKSGLEASPWFPLVFALAIMLLFEPLRRALQVVIDRSFFASRSRLQSAVLEMGAAFSSQLDPAAVVRDIVERLPRLLDLEWSALYLFREDRLERVAGPETLPRGVSSATEIFDYFRYNRGLRHVGELGLLRIRSNAADMQVQSWVGAGVDVVGDLATSRRRVGIVLLSERKSGVPLEAEELRLVRSLLDQAAIALETSMLLDERAHQAELERELEIAAEIQASLLPSHVELGDAWSVAAVCRPARQVGGDFFAELPASNGGRAVVYGDVSGKSVSGALMMMAAKEALHSIAATHVTPEELFSRANHRLYELGNRSFVALGYFACHPESASLRYVVAGQPHPLKRSKNGQVEELPLAEHRLPLGAMTHEGYEALETEMSPGDLVVAYSDGVIEAQSPDGAFFGGERLAHVVSSSEPEPEKMVSAVLSAIEQFTNGREPYDDLTLMVIARREVTQ